MLDRANYIALVGGGRQPKFPQNKVIIWDDAKQIAAITLEFRTSVISVRLSRARVIIVLLNSVHVYEFSISPKKLAIYETADNPMGLLCLGTKVFVFPGRTPGQAQIVELATGNVSIIPAHTSPLRALELSPDGEVLATASNKGTLIRVFSTSNCSRLGELRRGVDPATIYSIGISPDSSLLAVTSDKSTLHIFDLPHTAQARPDRSVSSRGARPGSSKSSLNSAEEAPSQKWGMLSKMPMLPRVFSDVYSFASARIETDDGQEGWSDSSRNRAAEPIPGIHGGKPTKGVIGWLNDYTVLIIGAGRDGRWEKFVVADGDDGKRYCIRQGWKRHLGG
ncbi:WD repeat domain phosphoinositide-interacting protein 3 [Agyrium rufum]|nr:WD repeat domain phosphoinositide-interacting protein 3 [Agyrium rufum]